MRKIKQLIQRYIEYKELKKINYIRELLRKGFIDNIMEIMIEEAMLYQPYSEENIEKKKDFENWYNEKYKKGNYFRWELYSIFIDNPYLLYRPYNEIRKHITLYKLLKKLK